MTVNILQTAWDSVFAAIANWPDTATAFNQTYKWAGSQPEFFDNNPTTFAGLPAISVEPSETIPEWYLHREQEVPFFLAITIWTSKWEFAQALDLSMKVRAAIWLSTAVGASIPIVRTGSMGFLPQKVGPMTWKRIMLGKDKSQPAIRTDMVLHLRLQDDPLA